MPKKRHDLLDVILKVMESPNFSREEKKLMFKWANKDRKIILKDGITHRDWLGIIVSNLISIVSYFTN